MADDTGTIDEQEQDWHSLPHGQLKDEIEAKFPEDTDEGWYYALKVHVKKPTNPISGYVPIKKKIT